MKNPNGAGNTSKSETTGWESVESEADKFDAEVARRATEAQKVIDEGSARLEELNGNIERLQGSSREHYADGGNLDLKTEHPNISGLEKQAREVWDGMRESRKTVEVLSTEQGRKAAAEKLREEAKARADRERLFQIGLTGDDVAELEQLEQRILTATNKNAEEQLKKMLGERKELIISRGMAIEQARSVAKESKEDEGDSISKEQDFDNKEAGENPEDRAKFEIALEFSRAIDKDAVKGFAMGESFRLDTLAKRVQRYRDEQKHSFLDQRQFKKDLAELERYGYNPSGESSPLFKELSSVDDTSLGSRQLEEIGRDRALHFKMLELGLKGDSDQKLKKRLKKHGFSKLPKSWDDKDFTSDEMQKMQNLIY